MAKVNEEELNSLLENAPTAYSYAKEKILPNIAPNFVADMKGLSNSARGGVVVPSEPVPSSGDLAADTLSKMAGRAMVTFPLTTGVAYPLAKDLLNVYGQPQHLPLAKASAATALTLAIMKGRAENEGSPWSVEDLIKNTVDNFRNNWLKESVMRKIKGSRADKGTDPLALKE